MQNAKVYSYLRFSDPRQASGNSIERQIEYAQRWAAAHNMLLDDTLSLRDEGLSAYHQRHIKQGALGTFLAAVEEGKIAPGSILVVEGLDRLSRAEPILAQAQLAQIVNAGITVVTASDGKEYNRERLKAQPMDLVYSLLIMIRAHEESDTKSKRVKASIRRLCERWQDGSYRGLIRNGKDPQWLNWNNEHKQWDLVPEIVDGVKLAVNMFLSGEGANRIVRKFDERGIKFTQSGKNLASHLYKIIRLPALVGIKRIEADGQQFELHDYYPAIISKEQFNLLQASTVDRARRKGKAEIPGVVTGQSLTYCGYCGAGMSAQNLMSRKRLPDGRPQPGHRRLFCNAYSVGPGCVVNGSCSVVPIERAVMAWCSDQMNLSALLDGADQSNAIRAKFAAAKQKVATIEKQIERITEALLAAEDTTPLAFVKKAKELESQLIQAREEVRVTELELISTATKGKPAKAEAWAALAEGVEMLDYDQRMVARKLVGDTFSRIVVYHHGVDPDSDDVGPHIDILLISKTGNTRMLRIHRRTGTLLHIENADSF